MKIFIDSADIKEIEKYVSWGICDGVTTNPSICLKSGVSGGEEGMKQRLIEIARLIAPQPLSVEVTSDDLEQVLNQARKFNTWAENITVKVTITDRNGNSLLPAIYRLVSEGISVNVTAMMTFNQAILAAKAINAGMAKTSARKIHNISIFAGRISEEHGVEQAQKVLEDVRQWLDFHNYKNIEIIVGSVRSPENVDLWGKSGAHILTIPPEVLAKCLLSARTKETVVQFINDASKAMQQL
ncbi:MAG: transaldolase [Parcubacteria group bacterium Gr01-1014_13]|nr:MAG: transaldolase [Parcubacteria group bacterium Gr01-1014_13]